MNTLNLNGKIDRKSIAVYTAIDQAAGDLDIPYVVVGASARDLVMHYGYGVRIIKATADIDFGFLVSGWGKFEALRQRLIESGFQKTNPLHRLIYDRMIVDLVPFGAIQNKDAKIAWPPDGDVLMNVLGFQEALNCCVEVIIQDKPEVTIPVVIPPGLSLLKIICWTDRNADLRSKDAQDLLYLIKSYREIPEVMKSIFDYPEMMEEFDHEIELASAFILGIDAAAITSEQTKKYLKQIENNQIKNRPCDLMVEDMCNDIEVEFARNKALLKAYFRGINHHH